MIDLLICQVGWMVRALDSHARDPWFKSLWHQAFLFRKGSQKFFKKWLSIRRITVWITVKVYLCRPLLFCIYNKPTTIRYHWRSTITYLLEINSSSISPFRVTVGTISGDCRTFHFQHLHENEDVPSSNGYFEKSFFFLEVSVEGK